MEGDVGRRGGVRSSFVSFLPPKLNLRSVVSSSMHDKSVFFFHLALAENIHVGSKKIIVAYGTNHNPNGINLFSFPLCISLRADDN